MVVFFFKFDLGFKVNYVIFFFNMYVYDKDSRFEYNVYGISFIMVVFGLYEWCVMMCIM